jgi:hypothetical protein
LWQKCIRELVNATENKWYFRKLCEHITFSWEDMKDIWIFPLFVYIITMDECISVTMLKFIICQLHSAIKNEIIYRQNVMFIFISVTLYRNANKNHVTVLKLLNIDNSTRTSINSMVVNYMLLFFFAIVGFIFVDLQNILYCLCRLCRKRFPNSQLCYLFKIWIDWLIDFIDLLIDWLIDLKLLNIDNSTRTSINSMVVNYMLLFFFAIVGFIFVDLQNI